jgi:hypothetical protein
MCVQQWKCSHYKKLKLSFCLTNSALKHEGVRGGGFIDPQILNLKNSWKQVVIFTPGEQGHGIHWIGGSVGPKAGLNDLEKRKISPLYGLKPRHLGRRNRSQLLYRLSNLAPCLDNNIFRWSWELFQFESQQVQRLFVVLICRSKRKHLLTVSLTCHVFYFLSFFIPLKTDNLCWGRKKIII